MQLPPQRAFRSLQTSSFRPSSLKSTNAVARANRPWSSGVAQPALRKGIVALTASTALTIKNYFDFKAGAFKYPNRERLDHDLENPNSVYTYLVKRVNWGLKKQPLSDEEYRRILENCKLVESGKRTYFRAHIEEVSTFLNESYELAQMGDYKQAWLRIFGAGVNFLAAPVLGVAQRNYNELEANETDS